jgi:hypothetical protein
LEKRNVQRKLVGENLGKKDMWKRNRRRKFWKKKKISEKNNKNK